MQQTLAITVIVTDSHGVWAQRTYFTEVRESDPDDLDSYNLPAIAYNAVYTVPADGPLVVDAPQEGLANLVYGDEDAYQYATVSPPFPAGTPVINANDGTFTYTPPDNYAGIDQFAFQATDSKGGKSNPASITAAKPDIVATQVQNNKPTTTLSDTIKRTTGVYIPVDSDDDDDDGNADNDRTSQKPMALPDNDLYKVVIKSMPEGTFTLKWGDPNGFDDITVWADDKLTTPVINGAPWDAKNNGNNSVFYVQGLIRGPEQTDRQLDRSEQAKWRCAVRLQLRHFQCVRVAWTAQCARHIAIQVFCNRRNGWRREE